MPSTKRASLPAKIATLTLAASILAALVAHASLSSGCSKAPAPAASAEPARTSTNAAARSASPPAASATAEPDDDIYMGASKSGAVVRPRKASDAGAAR